MGKKLLLVEGKDDEHVFKAIFGQHHLAHLDEIYEYGGYTKLIDRFSVRLLESAVTEVGVVVDADLDVSARWNELRTKLVAAGYVNVPSAPSPSGLVLDPPAETLLPRLGVWIMPDDTVPEILEHFLETLVPPGDESYLRVSRAVADLPANLRRFRDADVPKAKIHTYLAWHVEPGRPLGQSITRHVLQAGSPSCLAGADWLRRLYSL